MIITPHRLPAHVQVKDLVKPFGELKSFNLLKDPEGNSKGTAVFEYADRSGAEMAIKGLDGIDIAGKKLQVQVRVCAAA
jgi:splicing factor U2AF 65 kDa subunit